jgi:ecotropic viral integration site 5 protein
LKTNVYQDLKNQVLSNGKVIANVEEVINMDVQRSFTKLKTVDPVVLTNILKTYAYFNPEIEYCQGMNFVAGFLYLVFRDEEQSFKALQEIIEVNNMHELFLPELPRLKLFFYQLDRLLSIHLPQLHNHFKDEMVNSSYYSSPWFITIFTNSLQSQEGDVLSDKILELWDYFLVAGWKAIFRMALYLMRENEQDLLSMNFEQILNFVTEKPKHLLSEHMMTPQFDLQETMHSELKRATKDIRHLQFTLQRLEKEFRDSLEASKGGK